MIFFTDNEVGGWGGGGTHSMHHHIAIGYSSLFYIEILHVVLKMWILYVFIVVESDFETNHRNVLLKIFKKNGGFNETIACFTKHFAYFTLFQIFSLYIKFWNDCST